MIRPDLLALRLDKGMTQREVAAAAGVSLTVVQRLEAGGRANPGKAKAVADFYGVKVTDLMPVVPREQAA